MPVSYPDDRPNTATGTGRITPAKKKAKKKAKSKLKPKPAAPYNPAGITQYPSEAAFNTAVNTRAMGQLRPSLDDLRARRKAELGAHETRLNDITGYYDYDLAARNAALTRQQEALAGILTAAGVANTDAASGLSAALRPSADANAAAAAQLGVQAPGVDPAVASVLAAYGKANNLSLAGDFGAYTTDAANDIAMTGIERRDAGNREIGTHKTNISALDQERKDLMKQLPGFRESARSAILQELLANSQNKLAWKQFGEGRRSNKAQESLAKDQFGLAEEQFKESKRARKFDEKEARKQSKLNQDQLNLARDELNAKIDQAATEQDMQAAEGQAKQFDSATEYLAGYLAPGDLDYRYNENGKKVFSPKQFKNRVNAGKFNEVLTDIMSKFGLNLETAYQVMRTAPVFRDKADRLLRASFTGRPYNGPH